VQIELYSEYVDAMLCSKLQGAFFMLFPSLFCWVELNGASVDVYEDHYEDTYKYTRSENILRLYSYGSWGIEN
jgi:hypothetical protein